MATFENTVMIGRPIEEVFAFLSDFENTPRWNYAIVQTHKVSDGPVGVGTIYQQVRSVPSRSEERFEVTASNPPRQLTIQGQLGPFPSRLAYALDAGADAPCTPPRRPAVTASSSATTSQPPATSRRPRQTPVDALVQTSGRWVRAAPGASMTASPRAGRA